uniref:Uncharacterized protein n=1 Tax=Panagrolaimus superbus TaxID=310955 RepID=A0A914YE06_9BILA
MEEVIQMDDDALSDDESEAAAAGAQQDQQASLMSLIGFDPDADTQTEISSRRQCFPHHIDPFTCLLPLDLFYIVAGPLAAFRIPRLLKIYAFWEFFDLLDSSFSNPYAIRITRTFCYMIYIIHCNSCVYYMLSAWQAFGQLAYNYKGQWYLNKWVYNNQGL